MKRTDPKPRVFLVWVNDTLLGVFQTKDSAENHLASYRNRNPELGWERRTLNRWVARGILRAEIEQMEVMQ